MVIVSFCKYRGGVSVFSFLLIGLLTSNSCRRRNTDGCFFGSHRAANPDIKGAAREFLEQENAQRAQFYLAAAEKILESALWAVENDGTIDVHEAAWSAMMQTNAAVQLAPKSADVWFEAAILTYKCAFIQDMEEGYWGMFHFFLEAIRLDESYFEPFKKFLVNGVEPYNCEYRGKWWEKHGETDEECFDWLEFFIEELKEHGGWTNISHLPTEKNPSLFSKSQTCVTNDETCPVNDLIEPLPNINRANETRDPIVEDLKHVFKRQTLFETYITVANIRDVVGDKFLQKISQLAIDLFARYAKKLLKENPANTYEDINNQFFSHLTSDEGWHTHWPEMVNNEEVWPKLWDVIEFALFEYARQVGVEYDLEQVSLDLWTAVYVGHAKKGLQHWWHTHSQNIVSCVLYSHSDGKLPIFFADPRGLHPMQDFEQYDGNYDLDAFAPFHHPYVLFPKTGDFICFPSWLVHRVPRSPPGTRRVSFPSNLRTNNYFNSWYPTATL